MATLKDFYVVKSSLPVVQLEKNPFVKALVETFCCVVVEECDLDGSFQIDSLPPITVLGKKAEAALEALKASIES